MQRRRTDLHVEQHHLLPEAVHAAGREDGGQLHHLLAGGDAGGAVPDHAADEVHLAEQAVGALRGGERCADGDCGHPARD